MKITNLLLSVVITASMVLMANAQTPKQPKDKPFSNYAESLGKGQHLKDTEDISLKQYADSQVIEFLGSKDPKESIAAAKELFSRGERVIPELLRLKGDNRCFYGLPALGKKGGSGSLEFDYVCEGNNKVTLEITALYLISAIFEEDLEYTRAPFLHDEEDTPDGNTPENIKTAWKATKRWYETVKRDGIDYVREQSQWPLRSVGMLF